MTSAHWSLIHSSLFCFASWTFLSLFLSYSSCGIQSSKEFSITISAPTTNPTIFTFWTMTSRWPSAKSKEKPSTKQKPLQKTTTTLSTDTWLTSSMMTEPLEFQCSILKIGSHQSWEELVGSQKLKLLALEIHTGREPWSSKVQVAFTFFSTKFSSHYICSFSSVCAFGFSQKSIIITQECWSSLLRLDLSSIFIKWWK